MSLGLKAVIHGEEMTMNNIKLMGEKLGEAFHIGMTKGGLHLQRVSQEETPVEFGDMRASAFTEVEGKGFATKVTVGYTSPYALYVHEAIGMVLKGQPRPSGIGTYWSPSGKAKFLEDPAKEEKDKIFQIVFNEGKKALNKK